MAESSTLDHQQLLLKIALLIKSAFVENKTLLIFGNGGSASEAIHIAAEFTGKCVYEHEPWPALALSESPSALTAIPNDFEFVDVFKRQVQAFKAQAGIAWGLTTSGKSQNVLSALEEAKRLGMTTVLFSSSRLGSDTEYPFVDFDMRAQSFSTPRIQEIHLIWAHIICEIAEL